MEIDKQVGSRIAMLRFIMICGIVLLHTPNFVPIKEVGSGTFDFIKAFFQNAAFRSSVPVLTVISGFFLFGSGLDRRYPDLLRKKFKTIAVPFLFFNLTLVAAAVVAQRLAGITLSYDLLGGDVMTWLNASFGISKPPMNYPLNFLRDLLVLLALAPVFGWLIRHAPVKSLILIGLIFFNNFDGLLILRPEMPVTFFLGGMAAVYRWDLRKLDRFALPLLVLFIGICCYVVAAKVANANYLRLVSPFLIWPASVLLLNTAIGGFCQRMSKYSFFIFVAHAPLLTVSWMVYQRLGGIVPYPVYWIVTPVVTVAVLIGVYRAASALMPRAFAAVVGSSPPARGRASVKPVPATDPAS